MHKQNNYVPAIDIKFEILLILLLKIVDFEQKICTNCIETGDFIDKVGLTSQPPYCFICKVKNSQHLGF